MKAAPEGSRYGEVNNELHQHGPAHVAAMKSDLLHGILLAGGLLALGCTMAPPAPPQPVASARSDIPTPPPVPRRYTAHRAVGSLEVDGRLDEPGWAAAEWTAPFVDIEGAERPGPRLSTRVKMLWDDRHWYVAAELEEPHLWATLTRHDTVIFQDNDFELFVDPDGDAERYVELEINALGTVWDLFLPRPYRAGGRAVSAWDIAGLQAAVALDGTLNDPSDRDRGWTVELAIPWAALGDSGRITVPPPDGSEWRVNFSRVEWDLETDGDRYRKRTDPVSGRALPEHNWVWSAQGAVDMHIPERWGFVRFARTPPRGMGR